MEHAGRRNRQDTVAAALISEFIGLVAGLSGGLVLVLFISALARCRLGQSHDRLLLQCVQ